MSDHIIREIVSGNGNQFQVKEILQAHIVDDKDFQKTVLLRLESGTKDISANRQRSKIALYLVLSLILTFTGYALSMGKP